MVLSIIMQYNVLKEVTEWEYPNHTYVTTNRNQRVIGYYKHHDGDYMAMKIPTRFETRRRKFVADRAKEKEWNVDSE